LIVERKHPCPANAVNLGWEWGCSRCGCLWKQGGQEEQKIQKREERRKGEGRKTNRGRRRNRHS